MGCIFGHFVHGQYGGDDHQVDALHFRINVMGKEKLVINMSVNIKLDISRQVSILVTWRMSERNFRLRNSRSPYQRKNHQKFHKTVINRI